LANFKNGRAVLAPSDDRDFEPATAQLTDEVDSSFVRLHAYIFDDLVDQLVLAVPKPSHGFSRWRVVWAPLGELYVA
jgi:hypothetical protein